MTENQKTVTVGAVVGLAFIVGWDRGFNYAKRQILKRFEQKKELIAIGIATTLVKARDNNWTDEEFHAELKREMDFVDIVS